MHVSNGQRVAYSCTYYTFSILCLHVSVHVLTLYMEFGCLFFVLCLCCVGLVARLASHAFINSITYVEKQDVAHGGCCQFLVPHTPKTCTICSCPSGLFPHPRSGCMILPLGPCGYINTLEEAQPSWLKAVSPDQVELALR